MIVTLEAMKDFLGEDSTYSDAIITDLILSAEGELKMATGYDFSTSTNTVAKRVIRIMVWLSFFADRDSSKNTQYLTTERDRLITKLKYGGGPDEEI